MELNFKGYTSLLSKLQVEKAGGVPYYRWEGRSSTSEKNLFIDDVLIGGMQSLLPRTWNEHNCRLCFSRSNCQQSKSALIALVTVFEYAW